MITGLIHVRRPEAPDAVEHLADTLSALVEGVAAGLIGDAVIVAPTASMALDTVAEGSGARLVLHPDGASPWSAGANVARRDWILCLEAGDIPAEGWIRALDRFVGTARSGSDMARLRRPHAGLPGRVGAGWERVVGVKRPRAGDLVRRSALNGSAPFSPRIRPCLLPARLDRA